MSSKESTVSSEKSTTIKALKEFDGFDCKFTEEYKSLIEDARDKIAPYIDGSKSYMTVYYEVRGEEVGREFDTCDEVKCIKAAKKRIREQYGKGTKVKEVWYHNDGDHESIEICSSCGIPLNEWLTWAKEELEHLEGTQKWDSEFLISEGFLIHAILQSSPTIDYCLTPYQKHNGGEILAQGIHWKEKFHQRIIRLAQAVLESDFTGFQRKESVNV